MIFKTKTTWVKGRISSTTKYYLDKQQTVCTFLCSIKTLRVLILDIDDDLQNQNQLGEGRISSTTKYQPYNKNGMYFLMFNQGTKSTYTGP